MIYIVTAVGHLKKITFGWRVPHRFFQLRKCQPQLLNEVVSDFVQTLLLGLAYIKRVHETLELISIEIVSGEIVEFRFFVSFFGSSMPTASSRHGNKGIIGLA